MTKSPVLFEATDRELLHLSSVGNRDAFGVLVGRYQGVVCGVALSACSRADDSDDVAQDAFLAAWRQLDRLREPAKFKAWLCGIARQLALSAVACGLFACGGLSVG